MIDSKDFDELTTKLAGLVPNGVAGAKEDFEKNARALLQGLFSRLELVTREEFDAQRAVLQKTRAKLEQLEQTVAELQD